MDWDEVRDGASRGRDMLTDSSATCQISLNFLPVPWAPFTSSEGNLLLKLVYLAKEGILAVMATDLENVYFETLNRRQTNKRLGDALRANADSQSDVALGIGEEGERLLHESVETLLSAVSSGTAKAEISHEAFEVREGLRRSLPLAEPLPAALHQGHRARPLHGRVPHDLAGNPLGERPRRASRHASARRLLKPARPPARRLNRRRRSPQTHRIGGGLVGQGGEDGRGTKHDALYGSRRTRFAGQVDAAVARSEGEGSASVSRLFVSGIRGLSDDFLAEPVTLSLPNRPQRPFSPALNSPAPKRKRSPSPRLLPPSPQQIESFESVSPIKPIASLAHRMLNHAGAKGERIGWEDSQTQQDGNEALEAKTEPIEQADQSVEEEEPATEEDEPLPASSPLLNSVDRSPSQRPPRDLPDASTSARQAASPTPTATLDGAAGLSPPPTAANVEVEYGAAEKERKKEEAKRAKEAEEEEEKARRRARLQKLAAGPSQPKKKAKRL